MILSYMAVTNMMEIAEVGSSPRVEVIALTMLLMVPYPTVYPSKMMASESLFYMLE